jgi:hypothetical protein
MIGRSLMMDLGNGYASRHVLHLVVGVATDELLQSWAISNMLHRRWMILLNLESGIVDVWLEDDVSIAGYRRGWL